MKVTYNPGDDTLRILFCSAPIQESERHPAGLILDFDDRGRIVGLELASASEHLSPPYPGEAIQTNSAPKGKIPETFSAQTGELPEMFSAQTGKESEIASALTAPS